jgi:hypothetical protein
MKEIDGYWRRMGHLAIDTLENGNLLRHPLTPEDVGAAAEWFGYLLSEAHDMGMRLGEARGKYVTAMHAGKGER